jgi:hypothetical protein
MLSIVGVPVLLKPIKLQEVAQVLERRADGLEIGR